jgi:hypothetical protein
MVLEEKERKLMTRIKKRMWPQVTDYRELTNLQQASQEKKSLIENISQLLFILGFITFTNKLDGRQVLKIVSHEIDLLKA